MIKDYLTKLKDEQKLGDWVLLFLVSILSLLPIIPFVLYFTDYSLTVNMFILLIQIVMVARMIYGLFCLSSLKDENITIDKLTQKQRI